MRKTEKRIWCDVCGEELSEVASLSMYTRAALVKMVIETHHGERVFVDICTDCSSRFCNIAEGYDYQDSYS